MSQEDGNVCMYWCVCVCAEKAARRKCPCTSSMSGYVSHALIYGSQLSLSTFPSLLRPDTPAYAAGCRQLCIVAWYEMDPVCSQPTVSCRMSHNAGVAGHKGATYHE